MKISLYTTALVLAFCLLSTTVVKAAKVVVLTDDNFEHDTQATSGSTTGSWLVLFYSGNDAEVKHILETPVASKESSEEGEEPIKTTMVDDLLEEGIVAGIMDINENHKTVERLKIPGTPHAILLHKGKMYRSNTFEGLKDFAISEYELGTGEEIPSEPKMINTSNNLTKLGIMGALVLLLAAYVLKTYISEAMKDPKKKE